MEARQKDRGRQEGEVKLSKEEREVAPAKGEVEAQQTEGGKGGATVVDLVKTKALETLEDEELLGQEGAAKKELVRKSAKGKERLPAVTSSTRKSEAWKEMLEEN